jgi:glycerate 2-kinase
MGPDYQEGQHLRGLNRSELWRTMQPPTESFLRQLLIDSYLAAVAAADPLKIVAGYLPSHEEIKKFRKTTVVGAGKAAASMALAVERHWPLELALSGLVITRYGHGLPCTRVRVVEAGHPVPDESGEKAAQEIFDLVVQAQSDELIIVLISGGGSSLLSLPAQDIPMADLKALTQQLLASGAPIQDMNVVRKHLSRIQGGRLAQAAKATLLTLVISDVVGDDLSAIASGPTVPDPTTYADAWAILEKYQVTPPSSIRDRLSRGMQGLEQETPKPGASCFERSQSILIATAKASLASAAEVFAKANVDTLVLGDDVEGEASEVGREFAIELPQYSKQKTDGRPLAIISGGECTVTLRAKPSSGRKARGGRCSEFLLGCVAQLTHLQHQFAVYGLAADTDGIDGSEDNAGALFTASTLDRAQALTLDANSLLERNDAYGYFLALNDLVTIGPTLTNVNDYRVIVLV